MSISKSEIKNQKLEIDLNEELTNTLRKLVPKEPETINPKP